MMKIIISSIASLLIVIGGNAQDFTYNATIETVDSAGFHQVILDPFLLGHVNSFEGDIRVYDQNNQEIPYILTQESASSSTAIFREYEIIEKHFKENEVSYLVFHNPEKKEVNNISIIVQNTDVKKRARLSGSNDNKKWFVIKNNYLLHSMHSNKETTDLKILNFPLSDFEYFKLEINDYWKLPINILRVGYYDYEYLEGKVTSFNPPIIWDKDSAKTSYYELQFKDKKYFENLQFIITGTGYYRRYTTIYEKKTRTGKHNKKSDYFSQVASFELNSNSQNIVSLGRITADTLYVEVQNLDDQPLEIKECKASYLNKYLVLDLQPNKTYTIKFGDNQLSKPKYDLASFQDKIPGNLTVINHEKPARIKVDIPTPKAKSIFDNKYLIWVIIAFAGGMLAFVSFKMVKEIGDKPVD